jgi:hypothetical protein
LTAFENDYGVTLPTQYDKSTPDVNRQLDSVQKNVKERERCHAAATLSLRP